VTLHSWLEARRLEDPEALGFGWATVDLERSLTQTGRPAAEWLPVGEPLLGARGATTTVEGRTVVVLEPATEGRLAGWLARNGEGPAVRYRDGDGSEDPDARREMTALGRTGRLVPPTDPRDEFTILVDPTELSDGATSAPDGRGRPGGPAPRPSVDG
jgi:hypothetical protein